MFNIPERMSYRTLSDLLFGDPEAGNGCVPNPTVLFFFEAVDVADERYIAVVAEGMVIVPPFLVVDRETIPLFPQELECSASR